MSDGIYTSTYKRHFIWPPHIPRKTASIEDSKYPDLCGKDEPECDCDYKVCACPQPDAKEKNILPECHIEDWPYLRGVKSIYSESYDKEIQLQALRKKHRSPTDAHEVCEGLIPPKPSFPNPYLVPKEAFRPNLPRLQACPLKVPDPSSQGSYTEQRASIEEKPPSDLLKELEFPPDLQEMIGRNMLVPDKISVCRARPAAYRNIF